MSDRKFVSIVAESMEETKGRKEPCSTFNAGHTKDKSTSKL
jgi:hypothetical protein